jgi:hypothetical protein
MVNDRYLKSLEETPGPVDPPEDKSFDLRGLYKYLKETGKKPSDLTNEEKEQFVMYLDDNKKGQDDIRGCYLIATKDDMHGCIAIKTVRGKVLAALVRYLSLRTIDRGVEIITLTDMDVFSEYKPYNIIESEGEFISKVLEL